MIPVLAGFDHIGCPYIVGAFAVVVSAHPFDCFGGYFRKCPSDEIPVYEVGGFAHLNESEGHIFLFGLLPVLAEDGIGGIHVECIGYFAYCRIVHVVRSPPGIVFHSGDRRIVVGPRVGRRNRAESGFRACADGRGKNRRR